MGHGNRGKIPRPAAKCRDGPTMAFIFRACARPAREPVRNLVRVAGSTLRDVEAITAGDGDGVSRDREGLEVDARAEGQAFTRRYEKTSRAASGYNQPLEGLSCRSACHRTWRNAPGPFARQ